jgi:hypothetical protein
MEISVNLEHVPGVDPDIWRRLVRDATAVTRSVALAAAVCPERIRTASRTRIDSLEKIERLSRECGHSMRRVLTVLFEFLSRQEDLEWIAGELISVDVRLHVWCLASLVASLASGKDHLTAPFGESIAQKSERLKRMRFDLAAKDAATTLRSMVLRGRLKDSSLLEPFRRAHCVSTDWRLRSSVCSAVNNALSPLSIDDVLLYGIGISSSRYKSKTKLRTTVNDGQWTTYDPDPERFDEARGAYLSGLLSFPVEEVSSGAVFRSSAGLAGAIGVIAGAAGMVLFRR